MSFRFSIFFLVLLCGATARAQEAPDPLAGDYAKYGELFERNSFDEIIAEVNRTIEALPADERANPDARLLYYRGLAEYKSGRLDEAKADLLVAYKARVGEIAPGMGADWVLSYIKKREPLLPPKLEEIRDGDRTLFRLHTFATDEGTERVKAMLPAAYRINRQIFGADIEATTVYVFGTYEQFADYYKAIVYTRGPNGWAAARSDLGDSLFIVLRDDKGVLRARDTPDFFKTIVFKEYNHVLFRRLWGKEEPPLWFTEGLATVAGAQMERGADSKSTPAYYSQPYGQMKYLLDTTTPAQLTSFLVRLRASKGFAAAFAEEFGLTPTQLQQNWQRSNAQNNAAPGIAATAPASTYSDEDDAKYRALYEGGFYDELIYKVNAQIEASPAAEQTRPDPHLLWYRGMAEYGLGRLVEAKADLTASQNDGRPTYGTTETLSSIEQRAAARPPKMEEIRDGERALFRMYYFGMDDGAAFVKRLLPAAYRASREMFGTDVEATNVYVFADYAQFAAYYKAHTGEQLDSWAAAMALGDVALISLKDVDGKSLVPDDGDYLKTTIVHEINHAIFHRLMGLSPQPTWFVEGIAQVAGAQVSQDYVESKQRRLEQIFDNNVLLSMEDLENEKKFYAQTALGVRMSAGRDRDLAPDPYTQGYSLAKYLLANISTPQLQSFLNRTRESQDFKASFADEFSLTTEQFYQKWGAETARQSANR